MGVSGENAARGFEEWKRRPASEAEEVLQKGVGPQAEAFRNVTAQARAEVAGAGADKKRINGRGFGVGALTGFQKRLRREAGGMSFEMLVKFAYSSLKEFRQVRAAELAGRDARIAGEDFAQKVA